MNEEQSVQISILIRRILDLIFHILHVISKEGDSILERKKVLLELIDHSHVIKICLSVLTIPQELNVIFEHHEVYVNLISRYFFFSTPLLLSVFFFILKCYYFIYL